MVDTKSSAGLAEKIKGRIDRHILRPVYIKKEGKNGSGGYRAVHVTWYKARNVGDTVLSWCVRRTLTKLCDITGYDLVHVREEVTDKVIDRINKADILVIGGGGLFIPDTNNNSVSGWQWAVSGEQLEKIRVPLIIYAVGYNYFRGQSPDKAFEENLRLIAEKSSFTGLRNTGSCRAVEGILNETGQVCPVDFQPCATTLIKKFYTDLPQKESSGCVAVNIAFDREELRFGNDKELILDQIARALKRIEERGYKIFCAAHCREDLLFEPYLKRHKVRYKAVNMAEWFPKRAISFYNKMDCVIGMRGHAQMIPFGLGCEIISLGSHEKLKWFLDDIDANDWYIELRSDPASLCDTIYDTFIRIHETDHDITGERLAKAQDYLWEITKINAEKISGILRNDIR